MDERLSFIDFTGLNDLEVENLKISLSPTVVNPFVELPWGTDFYGDYDCEADLSQESRDVKKLYTSSTFVQPSESPQQFNCEVLIPQNAPSRKYNCTDYGKQFYMTSNVPYQNESYCKPNQHSSMQTYGLKANGVNSKFKTNIENQYVNSGVINSKVAGGTEGSTLPSSTSYNTFASKNYMQNIQSFSRPGMNVIHSDLNPLVSCFVPQKFPVLPQTSSSYSNSMPLANSDLNVNETPVKSEKDPKQTANEKCRDYNSNFTVNSSATKAECETFISQDMQNSTQNCVNSPLIQEKNDQSLSLQKKADFQNHNVDNQAPLEKDSTCNAEEISVAPKEVISSVSQKQITNPSPSWADVLKSNKKSQQTSAFSSPTCAKKGRTANEVSVREKGIVTSSANEDAISLNLGRHLYKLNLDFTPVLLQPRGLINRRNWCYINATLQALTACSPFYTLLRNLPLGPGVERGKSSTPVLDSMVKLIYEFGKIPSVQEDMKAGEPFQPIHIYDMLSVLKPHCIKGQQEDAEEFLSYILNGMHEEMASVIKSYEKSYNLNNDNNVKTNGHVDTSEGEEEWKVMGSRQRGVVTRLVAEHKSPISDLLGGQIKSFLTINGSNSSASIQPFFTLQLDIQAESVTSVLEALNQMIVKEPIHGYTCPKTKQEVEAYSRSTLQKIPPILILHLKRFIYDKNGGCKKVMKKTEYPINLELKKDLLSPEAKKARRVYSYNLFAVMYHDGEEAIKGHYISDIYHHGSKSWIRCDDRSITNIAENQVLSHNPPRVPYLLFYQINNSPQDTKL